MIVQSLITHLGQPGPSLVLVQWLLGGGLVTLIGAIFYLGATIGRVNQTLQDLARRLDKAETAIRDVEARGFGFPARPGRYR